MNGVNPIRHWCVRVPGETAWRDEIPSEREALASRELAANVALCVDPVVAGAKEMLGAEVVG